LRGLEKADKTGNVDYSPENHEMMVKQRQKKVDIVADFIPDIEVYGQDSGDLLVLSWGGVFGSVRSGVKKAQEDNLSVSHIHLRHLNPFPKNLSDLLLQYKRVLIPALNLGQLSMMIRSKFLVDVVSLSKVQGRPFNKNEILNKINEILKESN
jgi:2-oxoglutarate ferredoxin oxidoreductase subunit alpha